jgi:hypothetical protein
MDNLRMVPGDSVPPGSPCSRCGAQGQRWDLLSSESLCPDCQETLASGAGAPLVLRTEKRRCGACDRLGTVPYLTRPREMDGLLEIDLCPEHLRALLARNLEPFAFHQLLRRLHSLRLNPEQVFLLHSAFYNRQGQALQPVPPADY